LYDTPRLTKAQYKRLEFEWLHPREAEVLRTRGEAYPLDANGYAKS
jgi:hypothetical protein